MAKPVKDEIYGTRPSRLNAIFDFRIFRNLFFATCLHRINPNPASRYILLKECKSEREFEDNALLQIAPFFTAGLRLGNIFWEEDRIHIRSLKAATQKSFENPDHLAKFLLQVLKCDGKEEWQPSTATIRESARVSSLSKFLRLNMYGRVASTDIDFLIFHEADNRLTLLEEKLYTQGGGSIGHGQYLSFREIVTDIVNPEMLKNFRFYLMFLPEQDTTTCYIYNFMQERKLAVRSPAFFDPHRKEQRILFGYNEMHKMTLDKFLGDWLLNKLT